jgi:hypothetical protein
MKKILKMTSWLLLVLAGMVALGGCDSLFGDKGDGDDDKDKGGNDSAFDQKADGKLLVTRHC